MLMLTLTNTSHLKRKTPRVIQLSNVCKTKQNKTPLCFKTFKHLVFVTVGFNQNQLGQSIKKGILHYKNAYLNFVWLPKDNHTVVFMSQLTFICQQLLLCARPYSKHFTFNSFHPCNNSRQWYCYYSHFADQETEAQFPKILQLQSALFITFAIHTAITIIFVKGQ